MKQAIITAFLGRLRDRFCEYQEPLTIAQKLETIAKIPGVRGVEVVYPYEVDPPDVLKSQLDRLHLEVAAVNVNVKADPIFVNGSLSSPDPDVRRKALEFIKGAKDYARAVGADKVTCCPLSDGYDYSFHTHYVRAWERMVEVVREAAAYIPEIPLYLEYKPSETRVHCLLDSAAKTLLLCSAVDNPTLGVTIDVGHSIYGGETPAEALAHCAMSGHPYYVHINDNNGKWDWDLMVGTCNLWAYVEFLFYLKELGYTGWVTSDTSPVRQDPLETFAFNARLTARIWSWLDRIDRDVVRKHLERHEFLPIMKTFESELFARADDPARVTD
ncbi:MAG TPA: sugar phosphate isomerase/epimerase family protein [Bryobacteraceae bacterium]|nr:sugar phosphate isomerase/epimerase family protein [Bryobacteraceae bacterium]